MMSVNELIKREVLKLRETMKQRIFTNTGALLTGQILAKVSSSAFQLAVTYRCENWTIKRGDR